MVKSLGVLTSQLCSPADTMNEDLIAFTNELFCKTEGLT